MKNLKTAPGSEVEIKAGNLYQKKLYDGVPLLFGLDGTNRVDTIRITWANGMIQNQTDKAAGRSLPITEAPRLSGSCPMIFTWNGRAFQFITDVLGVAPLGASSGDGEYFPVDHDEYVRIPGEALAEVDGHYEVRITEELHEVSYLDQVRLLAVDHAAGTEIFTNEKFKSPPFPEFRLFGVNRRVFPVAARDDKGRDMLPALLRQDRVYAGGFRHDSAGVAELHALTLDFGPHAAPGNKAVLLLEGWVDWADGSTFYGTSQAAGSALVFPYLQVKDAAGNWKTVVEDMGIPAGKPKTIAVDLTGRFLSASREIRIVTNLCLYWDQIFLSEDAAAPPVRLTQIDARSAEVRLRGFSRPTIDPRRDSPKPSSMPTGPRRPTGTRPPDFTRAMAMCANSCKRPTTASSSWARATNCASNSRPPASLRSKPASAGTSCCWWMAGPRMPMPTPPSRRRSSRCRFMP